MSASSKREIIYKLYDYVGLSLSVLLAGLLSNLRIPTKMQRTQAGDMSLGLNMSR